MLRSAQGFSRHPPSKNGGSDGACLPNKNNTTSTAIFFAVFFIAWTTFTLFSKHPGFIDKDTVEVAVWAYSGLSLGHEKHPPLLTWLLYFTSTALPLQKSTLTVIAGLNLTLALFATWRVAILCLGERRAAVALLMYAVTPYLTFHVMKLNHNAILVSLWPLTVWAYLVTLQRPSFAGALTLGTLASLAMLAKYSSILLLAGIFIASLASVHRHRFYSSFAPYLSAVLFVALVAPHFIWSLENGNPGIQYAVRELHTISTGPWVILKDNALNLIPALIAAIAAGKAFGWCQYGDQGSKENLTQVGIIAAFTTIGTITPTVVLGLRGSPTWMMPVLPFIAVLLTAFIKPPNWDQVAKLRRGGLMALAGLCASAPLFLYISFRAGLPSAVEPRREVAEVAADIWKQVRDDDLRVVGGDYHTARLVALASKGRASVWPLADRTSPEWSRLERHGALIICAQRDTACQHTGAALVRRLGGLTRKVTVSRTLWGSRSRNVRANVYVVDPSARQSDLP